MRHLVVGAGEVGTALHAVLSRAFPTEIRDVEPVEVQADLLHICFPWSAEFDAFVDDYQRRHAAQLVVVHSTVPVGTCDQNQWVHSPVRGRHPALVESLLTFTKHFGGENAKHAAKLFAAAGCDVAVHPRAVETESAKLWELASFGLAVAFEKAVHAWCAERGLDFETVYTTFRHSYNDGYVAMGHAEFVQPVLQHIPGRIGGHCIVPSMPLLGHPLADLVVAASGEAEKDAKA